MAVLHTWGQNLSLHPHIQRIVPAAGYTLDGRWKNIGHAGSSLYPVHQLCNAFKDHKDTAKDSFTDFICMVPETNSINHHSYPAIKIAAGKGMPTN